MNQREIDELIEAMAEAFVDARDDRLYPSDAAKQIIRAANERRFDLCKLPSARKETTVGDVFWNNCLDAVEIVRIEGDKG